jgi:hypothetical protein
VVGGAAGFLPTGCVPGNKCTTAQNITTSSINLGNKDFTMGCWIYRKESTIQAIVDYDNSVDKAYVYFNGNNVQFHMVTVDNHDIGMAVTTDAYPFDTGIWHHWAVTFDKTSLAMTIFRDGNDVSTPITATRALSSSSGPITVGAMKTPTLAEMFPFTGYIDEVRAYAGTALSSAEIKDIMTSTSSTDAFLVTYLAFEGDGTPYGFEGNNLNIDYAAITTCTGSASTATTAPGKVCGAVSRATAKPPCP